MTTAQAPIEGGEATDAPVRRRPGWLAPDEGWERSEEAARLAASALIAVVAIAIKLLIVRWLGGELGYLSYVGAVALATWIAGFRGGLLATALCGIAEVTLFGGMNSANGALQVAMFAFDGVLVSVITSALRRAISREHEALARTEELLRAQDGARAASDRSRAELAALQVATASLSGASTPVDVATAMLDRGLEILGAVAGGVVRLDPSGGTVEVIAARGYVGPETRAGARLALDESLPLREALESRAPVFVGGATEWLSRYPTSPPRPLSGPHDDDAVAVLPLLSGPTVLGAAVFRFDRLVDFDAGARELAIRLAEQGAAAMDRALAYDRERRARVALERNHDRLSFLAVVSERLGATTDIGRALGDVADLAAAVLADWCIVELGAEAPRLVALAPAAVRPRLERLAPSAHPAGSVGRLLARGAGDHRALLLGADDGWAGGLADQAAIEALADLETRALLVALIDGPDGTPAGTVVLGASTPDRFDTSDIPLVRDLAERIGNAARQADLLGVVSRFKASVDASADAVFIFDPQSLRLTYTNRGGADLAGGEPATMIGQNIAELLPTLADVAVERLRSEEGDGGRVTFAGTLLRGDGEHVPVEAFLQEVPAGDGTTTVILTARDITDRLDVQERLTRIASDERRQAAELRAVIQAMHEGIVVIGPDGVVSLANVAAMTILGGDLPMDLDELCGRIGITPPGSGADGVEVDQAAGERHTVRLDDGRWLETAIYPTALAPSLGYGSSSTIVVLRDISGAKEAEAAREAFLGVLSHELRTPVTTIFGFAKVLQRPSRRGGRMELLRDIEAEADRLYRIVEDLLALSRVEGGATIEGEPILIQHIVEPQVSSEAQRWPDIRFEVEIAPGLPAVAGERTYVEQVLRNLLSNAGKYSKPGSAVKVVVSAAETEVLVRVLDRGIGITEGEKDRLFELFYRSPTGQRSATGAGIGLYVGRGLVTAMGGRIWAGPREGGGSEFGFSLPLFDEHGTAGEP